MNRAMQRSARPKQAASGHSIIPAPLALGVVLLAAPFFLLTACRANEPAAGPEAGASKDAQAVRYHCPMHPTMISDHPGDCPICQMRMVPIEEAEASSEPTAGPGTGASKGGAVGGATEGPGSARKIVYRSTMNPEEVSDKPGKDSMGMEMVPVEIEAGSAAPIAVPGLASVTIGARKQQLIGARTTPVVRVPFLREMRATARVTYDETRLAHVHSKIGGYVERLEANATGEPVRRGEPLLEIFSPELLASQQEFLVALKARRRTAGSSLASVALSGEEIVSSARRRLELFDMTQGQIEELERSGQAQRTVTIYAPLSGYVIQRNVTQGQKVEPEMDLLDIADLSRVWVLASVYEYELPFVHKGQKATMTLPYLPGESFEGRVSLIYPWLDPATRTAQVRIEIPNPRMQLKPEMYADVTLTADLGPRLAVPTSAVLETGARSIVFVDRGGGRFEPREITVGVRIEDQYEVLKGLSEGETVLSSGNFFVDSESQIKAAIAATAPNQTSPATGSGNRKTAPPDQTPPRADPARPAPPAPREHGH